MNYQTLIILDWDDTLFPTTWAVKNKIDFSGKTNNQTVKQYFANLDTLLYNILSYLSEYGQVVVITNATAKWIVITSELLPETQKLLKQKVLVISARDLEQEKYPNDIAVWKKIVFSRVVDKYFMGNNLQNIISIGDADYEFNALVNLYQKTPVEKGRLLKTIKFVREPTLNELFDELNFISEYVDKVIVGKTHMDLRFSPK